MAQAPLASRVVRKLRSIGAALGIPGAAEGRDSRYHAEIVELMRHVLTPEANAVDAGALKGEITRELVKIAPRGHHIAFEPQPGFAQALRRKFPQVTVRESALGDSTGSASFLQALKAPAYSGFRQQRGVAFDGANRTITVRVERLDDVATADRPVAFLKIDVEGAEYLVLRGAVETIRRDQPVIAFEYGRTGREVYGIEPATMWRLLHDDLGLELSLMRRWLDGGPAFDANGFTAWVDSGADWMFIAYPPRRAPLADHS